VPNINTIHRLIQLVTHLQFWTHGLPDLVFVMCDQTNHATAANSTDKPVTVESRTFSTF